MKNTKRKHLKLCLLLLFMVLGCFAITNVRTTTVSADDKTSDIPGVIFEHFLGCEKTQSSFFTSPFLFHIYHIINRLYTLQPAFITLSKIFNTDLFYLYACNVGVVRILSGVSTPSAVVTVYFITCGEPASTTRSTL